MAKALNESKLREWMTRMRPGLIALGYSICRDQHAAEDIAQEAFVKLWRSPPDAGEVAYTSWLRRVVTNMSINALQRTKRPSQLPEHSADAALRSDRRPDQRREMDEDLNRVQAAMDRLEDGKRVILVLRAVAQLSYEEIAETLNVPRGTVMSRLSRAREALSKELQLDAQDVESDSIVFDFRKYKNA